jgi:hypothetical protein
MLRILHSPPEFSLQNVMEHIPATQLQIPRSLFESIIDNPKLTFLEPLIERLKAESNDFFILDVITSNMKIIGRERNGKILLSRIGYDSRAHVKRVVSFIDYYDMNSNSRSLFSLYRFDSIINCVSCSANFTDYNAFPGLIAYVEKFKINDDPNDYYKTIIIEVHGRDRNLKVVTDTPQFVKFLPSTSSNKKRVMCWINNNVLWKCLIEVKSIEKGAVVIKTVSKMEKTSDIYWFDWNYETDQLYIINRINNVNKKNHSHALKIFQSIDPRFEVNQYLFSPEIDRRDDWKMVEFDENNLILCQRHYGLIDITGIKITIHSLRPIKTLSYVIELRNLEPEQLEKAKVLFQRIDNSLLVYIPGYHFQLIHFNSTDPTFGLCLSEFATPLPLQQDYETSNIDYFEDNRQTEKANLILDSDNGVVYKYYFHSATIHHLFEDEGAFRHLAAMHFVIVHLQNLELRDAIISNMLSRHPEFITAELLTEYILGSSYLQLTTDFPASKGYFPISTLQALPKDTRKNFAFISDIIYSSDPETNQTEKPVSLDLFEPATKSTENKIWKNNKGGSGALRYSSPKRHSIVPPEVKQVTKSHGLPSPFLRLVSHIFLSSNNPVTVIDAPSDPNRGQIIDFITQHLLSNGSLNRNEVVDWAVRYRDIQAEIVNGLFKLLTGKKRKRSSDRIKTFRVLSNLHCSLERNWFPFPETFKSEITKLGYKCLPRNIFSQFLEMGVFDLSPDFMQYILSHSESNPESSKYIQTFINQLSQEEAVEILLSFEMEGMDTKNSYLIEYLLSKTNKYQKIDMEEMVDADFLPLSIYLESLCEEQLPKKETFTWVKHESTKIFKQELEIPDLSQSQPIISQ